MAGNSSQRDGNGRAVGQKPAARVSGERIDRGEIEVSTTDRMPSALIRAIQRIESQGDHEHAQRLRDGFRAQQAAKQPTPPDEPPPAAPAIPLAASPPLSRTETIRQLCQLYGHADRTEYFIAGGGTPAQVMAALAMLGRRG